MLELLRRNLLDRVLNYVAPLVFKVRPEILLLKLGLSHFPPHLSSFVLYLIHPTNELVHLSLNRLDLRVETLQDAV